MDLELKSKGVIILGGSKGIGKSIAKKFAQEGANVSICARGEEALKETHNELEQLGSKVYSSVCDISNPEELNAYIQDSKDFLGKVDILVHNASALALGPSLEDWKSSLDVDLMAAVNACEKVIPWMLEAGSGSILLISSISGLECDPSPNFAYAAAKAALIAYAKKLAVLYGPKGLRANAIAPGSIVFPGGVWEHVKQTQPEMYEGVRQSIPAGRLGSPDEVADVAVFIASPKANWVTGECISVDGAQHRGMR